MPASTSTKGQFTLLAKLRRDRDEIDAAIRVLQRYTKSPEDQIQKKATKAAALVAEVNGAPVAPPLRGNAERVYAALTDQPISPAALARQLHLLGPKENPGMRVSSALHNLRLRHLVKRTKDGWLRT